MYCQGDCILIDINEQMGKIRQNQTRGNAMSQAAIATIIEPIPDCLLQSRPIVPTTDQSTLFYDGE